MWIENNFIYCQESDEAADETLKIQNLVSVFLPNIQSFGNGNEEAISEIKNSMNWHWSRNKKMSNGNS